MAHPDSLYGKQSLHGVPSQSELWNRQHLQRGVAGPEGTAFRDVPNHAAQIFSQLLAPRSTVLEVGSANGRDARFWARLGHMVHCVDFSPVALEQLSELACSQGVGENIVPVLHDVSGGRIPDIARASLYHGFYARSALHVDDATLDSFASGLNHHLIPGAVIMIEGKSPNDPKIQRSCPAGSNLVVDLEEGGHLRRVWTQDSMGQLAASQGWEVKGIEEYAEEPNGHGPAVFVRMTAVKI